MDKYRINTTVSRKHWELLKKYSEKYDTQQKTLEHALECLDNNSKLAHKPTPEEELWERIGREIKDIAVIFQKSSAKLLLENIDLERMREYVFNQKPAEFAIEYYYKKPLKVCSFQEIIDASILKWKVVGGLDMIDYKDNGRFCTLNIIHSMGLNFSKILVMEQESLFKSCNIKAESDYSDRSVFFKIYKN
jgi:hypothetical protein